MSYSMDCVPLPQLCSIYTLVPGMCTMSWGFFFSLSFAHPYVYYCCFVDESFFQGSLYSTYRIRMVVYEPSSPR